jgi:hypothetical protein
MNFLLLSRCKNPPLPTPWDLPKHQDIHLVLTMGKAHGWEGAYSQNGLSYCLIIGPPWGLPYTFKLQRPVVHMHTYMVTAYVHVFCSPNSSNKLRMIVQHHCSLKQLQLYPKRILCWPTLNPVTISDFQELTLPAGVSLRRSIVEAISLGHSSIEGAHAPYLHNPMSPNNPKDQLHRGHCPATWFRV